MEGSMETNAINHLNALLKGEQTAIGSYEKYIRVTEDEKIKSSLRDIQQDHKEHAAKLADRIKAMGGRPDYGTGIAGMITNIRFSLEARNTGDAFELLKSAYDGEDRGIAMTEKVVKSGLDEESRDMLKRILSDDHGHLKSMLSLLTEYGYK